MLGDPMFYLLAVPAVLLAGVSKAGFGSGASFVATPLLALVIDPALALGIMLPLLILIDVATLRPYWKKWSWPDARALVIGGVPGVLLGAWLFQVAEPDVFRLLIGAISIGFVAYQLFGARAVARAGLRPFPAWVGVATGTVAGFTSFVSHAGGPPVAVYLLARGLAKTTYQATTVLTFWAVNIMKFVPYAFLGIFTADTLIVNAALAPVALLGAWLGIKAHFFVPERLFFIITYTLLVATGTKLIWDAVT
ncbi:MAG: sulfite exporter TauE/SafE family protein [Pseudomonadota bacterium]